MNRSLIIILVAGLLVRLFLFFYFLNEPNFFWDDDSNTYIYTAENMLAGNGFSWDTHPPYRPDAFRTPGYPIFLLLHIVLFGNYYVALITQLLLGLGIAFFIFLLAKEYGSPKTGYWAAAVFLAMPFSIMVNLRFLTQSLFAFTLIMAVWFWLKFLKSGGMKNLLITAILLPILALIRPIAQFIYLPFILSFIYSNLINGNLKVKNVFRVGVVVGAIFFLGIFPWLYRNYVVFGHFSISSIVPSQMYFYDAPDVYAYNHGISKGEAANILVRRAEKDFGAKMGEFSSLFSSGAYLKEKALEIMFEHPSSLFIVRGTQFFKFFIRDGTHYWSEKTLPLPQVSIEFIKSMTPLLFFVVLERFFLFLLFLGTVVTAISSFRNTDKGKKVVVGLLTLVILYFASLSGTMSSAGLRYPIEALFILTGLTGLSKLSKYVQYCRHN
ncbi:MAG TPA: glycosyltransferase family 39 protein [Candidatus Paceibacterota bacterium]